MIRSSSHPLTARLGHAARPIRLAALLALAILLSACGGAPADSPGTAPDTGASSGHSSPADQAGALVGDPEHGAEIFTTCAGCHGPDARGIQGLGKDLHNNAFLAGMNDDEAVAFLKTGRPATHELNTTGVDMPPKGGNPAYTDQDLYDIVAYIRTLE